MNMRMLWQAMFTTALVLLVIGVANRIPFTRNLVQLALNG
jgi:hypothetical protein